MARSLYAGRLGDTVVSLFSLGRREVYTTPIDANGDPTTVTLEIYDAPDGTQLVDLLAADGTTAITSVTVPTSGQIPEFYGPDAVNVAVYAKDPDGDYHRLDARADAAAQAAVDAQVAAEAAQAAAEAVPTTNDGIAAGLINDEASSTRAALNASFAPLSVATRVTSLEDTTPTTEEVGSVTVPLAPGGAISAATTIPLHSALYGETIEQLSLVVSAAVAASDTDYWTARLVRYRGGVSSNIATKTTKTTASGGEAMTAFTDWNLDTAFWGATRQLAKGDVLALVLTPTGAPAALTLPAATFRLQPDDGADLPLLGVAWDYFARADSTTGLGTSTSGHAWVSPVDGAVAGISAEQAYRVDATAPRGYWWVDSGYSDARVSIDIPVAGATLPGPCFRMSLSGSVSGFTTDAANLYRVNADGTLTALAPFTTTAVQGDNVAIVGDGSSLWVEKNGVAVTTPVTDTLNQTSTLHGFRISSGSGSYRLDNFLVAA